MFMRSTPRSDYIAEAGLCPARGSWTSGGDSGEGGGPRGNHGFPRDRRGFARRGDLGVVGGCRSRIGSRLKSREPPGRPARLFRRIGNPVAKLPFKARGSQAIEYGRVRAIPARSAREAESLGVVDGFLPRRRVEHHLDDGLGARIVRRTQQPDRLLEVVVRPAELHVRAEERPVRARTTLIRQARRSRGSAGGRRRLDGRSSRAYAR